jgi:hypothetical protein
VRLYTTEPGELFVRDLVRSAAPAHSTAVVFACDLARPETFAALRKISGGADAARRGLRRTALRLMLPRIRRDFGDQEHFVLVSASSCMAVAADIAERHPIKGADAAHIASALAARNLAPAPEQFFFVSEDTAQGRVAEAEGLQVLRPAA